jgi:hypothetical protein
MYESQTTVSPSPETRSNENDLQIVPTNALHSLQKNGTGSFKLIRRRSSKSLEHTHQVVLSRSLSTPPGTTLPSLSLPASPGSPPVTPTTPTGSLRRSSRMGSLSLIPEADKLSEALEEAAASLAKKSDYFGEGFPPGSERGEVAPQIVHVREEVVFFFTTESD